MTDVQLGSFVFQSGDVQRVKIVKSSQIDATPLPMSDSPDTILFDFDGVSGNVTLNGFITDATSTRVAGGSVLTIAQQVAYLRGLINGNQSAIAFTSNYCSINVMISKVDINEEAGNPNSVPFTIDLTEGDG